MINTIKWVISIFDLSGCTPYEVTAQLVGYIGLIFTIIGFQCKKHKNIMLFRTGNEVFFGIQFFMLHAYTGLAMNIIGSIRNIIFARRVEQGKSTRIAQFIFSILFVVFGLITANGYISILIIAAKVLTTFAYGMKNTTALRFLTVPSSAAWLTYNIWSGSAAAILTELLTLTSIATGIIRLDIYPFLKKKFTK